MKKLFAFLILVCAFASAQTVTFANLDNIPGWKTCGSCGNSGGGVLAKYSQTVENKFAMTPGASASEFWISSIGKPYGNGYWWLARSGYGNYSKYTYSFYLYVPIYYATAPQGIEFEIQPTVNGNVYNGAWQAEWHSKQWRIFNYAKSAWESTGIPLNLKIASWNKIVTTFHRANGKMYHDTLQVNNVVYHVNRSHYSVYKSGHSTSLNNAFQLDTTSAGTPYGAFVDGMQLVIQ